MKEYSEKQRSLLDKAQGDQKHCCRLDQYLLILKHFNKRIGQWSTCAPKKQNEHLRCSEGKKLKEQTLKTCSSMPKSTTPATNRSPISYPRIPVAHRRMMQLLETKRLLSKKQISKEHNGEKTKT